MTFLVPLCAKPPIPRTPNLQNLSEKLPIQGLSTPEGYIGRCPAPGSTSKRCYIYPRDFDRAGTVAPFARDSVLILIRSTTSQ